MSDKLVEKFDIRGISVYRFYKNNRDAVDQYLTLIDADAQAHIDAGDVDKPMAYVLDVSRSGMYSLNYMRNRASVIIKLKSEFPASYIAYVTDKPNDAILLNMVNAMATQDVDNTRKIFKTEDLEQAVDWLLGIKNNS